MEKLLERQPGNIYLSKNNALLWLLMVFLTFPHLKPAYLEQFAVAELIINCWRIASFIIIFIWLLAVQKKISLITILIGIQQLFLLFTTVLHKGEAYNCAASLFSVMSIVLLYDLVLAQDERDVFLSSQLFCFELVIYINFITELLYPNGIYVSGKFPFAPNWFLGYYNGYTKQYIPALMFAGLYKKSTGKKYRAYFLVTVILLSAFKVFAGGITVSLLAMAIAYFVFRKYAGVCNYYTYWCTHIIFFLLIIVLKLQNLLQWFINDFLGKWRSLISRMELWDWTQKLIRESILLGHGVQSQSVRTMENGATWRIHAHNQVLELLYQGGIVGLGLWIIVVIVAGTAVYRYRNTEESKIISVAFLGWCVATLVEPFTSPFFMGMFVVAYRSNSEINTVKEDVSDKHIAASVQVQE